MPKETWNSTEETVTDPKIVVLEQKMAALEAENKRLSGIITAIETNIVRQIEMYNQHIANLHVKIMQ